MENTSGPNRQACFAAMCILILMLGACGGGGTTASGGGGSGGGPGGGSGGGSGGGGFQARPFPGDYFMHLPNQDGGAWIPYEAYDPALKEVFACDSDVNAVEVYSTVDGHRVGEISVPGPAGLSFSTGDAQLVIGTITPYVYIADPVALHITKKIAIPASNLTTDQSGNEWMPVMPYAMADGTIFLGMGTNSQSSSSALTLVQHLLRYSPTTGTFTAEDPGVSTVVGNPALSLDGKKLLVPGLLANTGALFLYTTDAQMYTSSSGTLQNTGFYLAANADGSQFATVEQNPAPGVVTFYGPNLEVENTYTLSQNITGGAIYSRDGQYLYAMTNNGFLVAMNTKTGMPSGYLGLVVGSLPIPSPQFYDVDETYHLFGAVQPGGVLSFNASLLQHAPPVAMPDFIGPSTEANPNVGPLTGGTQIQFNPAPGGGGSGDGISSSMEAYFGATPATQDVVAPYGSSSNGENLLTSAAPPNSTPGPVPVLLTDANNDAVYLPDAYTYGPHLLRVQPNAASAGDTVTIYAYGLGFFDVHSIQVTIGGAAVDMHHAVLNSYASFDYPEQSVTIPVPAGTPGWADITLTTPNGSDTLKRGIQYLQQEVNLPGGPFTYSIYDPGRDRFYLTGNGNTVAVFNPESQAFVTPLQAPKASSSAVFQGEALTPDGSKLLVADPTDLVVVIFDLTAGTRTTVNAMLPSDPTTTVFGTPQPMFVEAAADDRAFVSIVPCIPNKVREINLTNLSVTVRPDAGSSCANYVPYLALGQASADGSTIIFSGNSGEEPPGPEYVWKYSASSDTFTGPVMIGDAPWVGGQATVNSDGSVMATGDGMLDQNLLPLVPLRQGGLDSRLHETGSLLYTAYNSVSVSDTHNGVQSLMIGLPSAIGPYRPLAIDPSGEKILVAEGSGGVSYFELSVVPLAVGTVSPAQTSAGGSITIRGSGFVASTAVKIGGQTATCTETSSEALSCVVPSLPPGPVSMALSNPDGQTYAFEYALVLQ
ncbi:MAG: IPT/TIG domain-containing protein [Candidatus Acidiferrales bacterium]